MYVLVAWYWLVYTIYNTEASHLDLKILKPDTKGRSVNLALETVVEFDNQNKAENIKFLDNVNKLIGKVKTAISNNNKARREFSGGNVETFTDFIQHAIDVLNSYADEDLEDFFSILNDEVRKYHYRGCKFHELTDNYGFRTFLADKLDAAKNVKVTDIRDTLEALSHKIEEERFDKLERNLVDFVDSLYSKDSIDNLKKFLIEINDFKANKGSYTDLVNIIKEGLRSTVFDHYTNLNHNARAEFKTKIDEYWDNYSKQFNIHGTDKEHSKNYLKKQGEDSLAYFRYPKKGHNTTKSPKDKEKFLKQVHVEKVKYNPTFFTSTTKEATTMKKLTFMTLYPEFETLWPGLMSETRRPRFKSQFETNKPRLKSELEHRPKSRLKIEMKLRKWKGNEGRNKLDKIQPNVKIPQRSAFMDSNEHERHESYEILLPKRLNQETNTEHSERKKTSESRIQKHRSTSKKPISIGYLTAEISNTIKKKLAKLNKKLQTEHTSKYLKEMPEPKSKEKADRINFRSRDDTKDDTVITRIQNLESELRNVKTQLENDTKLIKNLKNKVKETDSRRIESGMNKYYLYETNNKKTTEKIKDAYSGDFGFNAHIDLERPKKIYQDLDYEKAKKLAQLRKSNLLKNNYYAKDKNQMNIKSDRGKNKKHAFSANKYTLHDTDKNAYKSHFSSQNENKYKKDQLHTERKRMDHYIKAFNKFENNINEKYHGHIKMKTVNNLNQGNNKLGHKNNYYMRPWSSLSRSKHHQYSKRKEFLKNINKNKSYKPNLGRKVAPRHEKKYHDERKSKAEIQFVLDTKSKTKYNKNKNNKYASYRHANNHNYQERKEKTTNIAFYRKMINDDKNKIDRHASKESRNKENIHETNSEVLDKDKENMESNNEVSYKNKKVPNHNNDNDMYKRYSADNEVESAEKYNNEEYVEKYSHSFEKEKKKTHDTDRINTSAEENNNDLENSNEISHEIPIQHPSRKHFAENNAGIVKNFYSVKDMFSKNENANEKKSIIRYERNSEEENYDNQPSFEQDKNIIVSDPVKQDSIKNDINITTKEVYYSTYPTTRIRRDKSLENNKQEPVMKSQTYNDVNKYDDNEKKHEINRGISNTFAPNTQELPSDTRKPVSELSRDKITKEIMYKMYTESNTVHDVPDNDKDDKLKDIQYAPTRSMQVPQYINNQTYNDENKNYDYISSDIVVTKINNAAVMYANTTPMTRVKDGQDECSKSILNSSSCKNNELEHDVSKHSLRKDIQYKPEIVKDTANVEKDVPNFNEHVTKTNLAHTNDDININGKVISKTNFEVTSAQYERMTFGLNKRFKKVSRVTDSDSKKVSEAVSEVTDRVKKDKEIKHDSDQFVEKRKDIPTKDTAEKYDHVQRTDQKVLSKEMDSNQKYSVRYEKIFDVDDPLFQKTKRLYESDKNTATDIDKQNEENNLQYDITTVPNERKSSTFDRDNKNALNNYITGHSPINYSDRINEEVKYQTQEKSNTDIHDFNDKYNRDRYTGMTRVAPDVKVKSNINPVDNGGHQLTGHITDKIRVEFKNGEIHISNISNSNTFKANNEIPDIDNIRDMADYDNNMFGESNRKSGLKAPVENGIQNDININHINNTFENEKVVGHLKAEISADVLKALETAAQSHEDINNIIKQDLTTVSANDINKNYPQGDHITAFAGMYDRKLHDDTNVNRWKTDIGKNVDESKSDTHLSKQKGEISTTKIDTSEKDNGNYNQEISNYNTKSNHIEQQTKLFPEILLGKANRRFSNDFERPGEDKYKGIDQILRGPKIDQADLEAHMNDIWESMNRTGYTDKMPKMPIRMAVSDELLASDTPPFFEPQRKVFAPTAPAPLTTKVIDPPTVNTDPSFGTLFPQNNFDEVENRKEITEATEPTLSPTDNPLRATSNDILFNPSNLFNDFNDEMGPKTGASVPPVGINNEMGKIPGVDSVEALKSKVSDRLNLPKGDLKTGSLDSFLAGIAPNVGEPPDGRRNLFASHTEAHRDVNSKEIFDDPTLKDMDRDMQF